MDDSDVKIFKKEKRDDKFDEIGLISKMNEERGNGNIDKSKQLGSYLLRFFLTRTSCFKSFVRLSAIRSTQRPRVSR